MWTNDQINDSLIRKDESLLDIIKAELNVKTITSFSIKNLKNDCLQLIINSKKDGGIYVQSFKNYDTKKFDETHYEIYFDYENCVVSYFVLKSNLKKELNLIMNEVVDSSEF